MSAALQRRSSGPSRHVYDAIVLAGEWTGALIAACLAKRGKAVLVVEHGLVDGVYERDGWLLPLGPSLFPPLSELPALEALFTELGVLAELKRDWTRLEPQLLAPRRWLELPADERRRAVELTRAGLDPAPVGPALEGLREVVHAQDSFFAQPRPLPVRGFFAKWGLKRALKKLPPQPAPRALPAPLDELDALAPLCCALADPGQEHLPRSLWRTAAAPHAFPRGRHGLRTFLLERARTLGADVLGGELKAAALVLDGAGGGVRLDRGDTLYRAPQLIAACGLPALRAIAPDRRQKALTALATAVEEREVVLSVHAIVPPTALPPGLGQLAVISALGKPKLVVTAAPAVATAGNTAAVQLTLHVVLDATAAQSEPAIAKAVEDAWARADDVLPFSRAQAKVQSASLAHAASLTPPWPLYGPGDPVTGFGGVPVSCGVGKLLLAGRQVLPALGVEGEVLAAQQVLNAVEAATKKPKRE